MRVGAGYRVQHDQSSRPASSQHRRRRAGPRRRKSARNATVRRTIQLRSSQDVTERRPRVRASAEGWGMCHRVW